MLKRYIFLHSFFQVYADDTEYSLEEIRSRKFELRVHRKCEQPTEEPATQPLHNYSEYNASSGQCSALETLANCALDAETDHLAQLMPINVATLQNVTRLTNMHSPGEPKVLVNMDSKELSELAARTSDDAHKHHNMSDKENLAYPPPQQPDENSPNYRRNHLVEEFDRSLMGNLLGDSVTVNTKEARWELRNLFNDNGISNGKRRSTLRFRRVNDAGLVINNLEWCQWPSKLCAKIYTEDKSVSGLCQIFNSLAHVYQERRVFKIKFISS